VYPTFLAVAIKLSPETIGLIGVLYGLVRLPAASSSARCLKPGPQARHHHCGVAGASCNSSVRLRAYGRHPGIGAVLMQFMVQGAWGVVPAYLTELSPAPVRATAPGLAYQLGALITAWNGKARRWQQNAGAVIRRCWPLLWPWSPWRWRD